MKKMFAIMLAGFMIFTGAACNKKDNTDKLSEKVNEEIEDSLEMFSVEAAEYYLEKATGIKLSELEPDWEWEFENKYSALGEDGRAKAVFTKKDGELSQDDINAYYKKVFDKTAAVSQDGYNIIGYEFVGEGEDALGEVAFEDATTGWIPGWAFRKDGIIYAVYVGSGYDKEKESTIGSILYYNSVEAEITEGMQKGWDDYMSDIEENADEIEEALKGFTD